MAATTVPQLELSKLQQKIWHVCERGFCSDKIFGKPKINSQEKIEFDYIEASARNKNITVEAIIAVRDGLVFFGCEVDLKITENKIIIKLPDDKSQKDTLMATEVKDIIEKMIEFLQAHQNVSKNAKPLNTVSATAKPS